MLGTAVADEVLRYLYFASLRPLATLAFFATLMALVVVLAVLAWHGHRPRTTSRSPARAGSVGWHRALPLVGALVLLLPPLLP